MSTRTKATAKQRLQKFVDPRERFADLLAPVKVMGRPSGYRPEFGQLAIRLGSQGESRAAIAASIGICREQLGRWEDKYPEFRSALAEAKALEQKWWERMSREGSVMGGQINAGLVKMSMAARFPHDYTERSELSGPNGGEIPHKLEVEFVGTKSKKERST